MNWRPWLIVALLIGVVVVNSALMYFEEVAGPEEVAEAKDEVKDKLATIAFTPATRRANFTAFGLPEDLVEATADQAKRVEKRKDRLVELLREHADVVGPGLCAGIGSLPQRYAALAFLVAEGEGKREVMAYDSVTYFETQEWFDAGLVQDIFNEVELSEEPREAATAMGVAAILQSQEDSVIEGKSPWGKGLGQRWSLERVFANHGEAKRKLTAYFAFMHVLTEWANQDGGICG